MKTIGVDVGGTKIAAGVVRPDGTVEDVTTRPTPEDSAQQVVEAVVDVVQELRGTREPDEVAAVGLSVAGLVDRDRRRVMCAPNLPWDGEPVRDLVAEETGLPVTLDNDGNAAAWAEFVHGVGAGQDDLLLVAVGTGIGGGLIVDGELERGAFGMAGEIGHLQVVAGGLRCGCGNLGCWEPYGSGDALTRRARAVVARGDASARALTERCAGRPSELSGKDVTELARQGDPASRALLADLGRWLGIGTAALAAVLDPGTVVLGGGLSSAGELVLTPMEEAYRSHLTGRGRRPTARFAVAGLQNDAGLIGAATLAAREVS